MSETENKKPILSKLAVTSFLLVTLGLCGFITLQLFCNHEHNDHEHEHTTGAGTPEAWLIGLPIAAGVALGVIADNRIRKSKGNLRGRVFSTSAFIIAVIAIVVIILSGVFRTAC